MVEEMCRLIERTCTADQLRALRFTQINEELGSLYFDFSFDCELSDQQWRILDARVFALRNRSVFSCITCGQLVKDDDFPTTFCAMHVSR